MLRKIRKRIKGQSTAEYAILIALVVAAVVAMQTFTKRLLQAKIYDAGKLLVDGTSTDLGSELQYEPYYLESNFTTDRDTVQDQYMDNSIVGGVRSNSTMNIRRGGGQISEYGTGVTLGNGMQ